MGEGDSRTLALGLPRRLTTEEEGSILRVCVCVHVGGRMCARETEKVGAHTYTYVCL